MASYLPLSQLPPPQKNGVSAELLLKIGRENTAEQFL